MTRIITLIVLLSELAATGSSQSPYWQQELKYDIQATLDTRKQRVNAQEKLVYINHSPDTLHFIWFHLWANAYLNVYTPFYQSIIQDRNTEKEISNNRSGFIGNLDFKVDGQPATTKSILENTEVIQLMLPDPLLPGDSITITTPFVVQLPNYFSRMGVENGEYMISQWFPKPAVYDRKGWHYFPYLDKGEFYGEFGSFEVSLTVPSNFVVAATGQLTSTDELLRYKKVGLLNRIPPQRGIAYSDEKSSKDETKTLHYFADKVHDFAWFADKNFIIQYDSLMMPSGQSVDIFTFFRKKANSFWWQSTNMVKTATIAYSHMVGEYPYPVVQAVEGPLNTDMAGMEYPMITLISLKYGKLQDLSDVILHEVGHNWFYGVLASNEREHPWMDEGVNTFFEYRYENLTLGGNSIFNPAITDSIRAKNPTEYLKLLEHAFSEIKSTTPIAARSESFPNKDLYNSVVYLKTAIWLLLVENRMGKEDFDSAVKDYFETWKFRHPYPEDFKEILKAHSKVSLEEVFSLLEK